MQFVVKTGVNRATGCIWEKKRPMLTIMIVDADQEKPVHSDEAKRHAENANGNNCSVVFVPFGASVPRTS